MDFLRSIFVEHSAFQAIVIISLISALGVALSKVKVFGISLGVTFIFFVGILAGHFGLNIDPEMSRFAEGFGLVIFVYALGLQVGPGFFASMRSGGGRLQLLACSVVVLGTILAVGIAPLFNISITDISGILCGATTNTPALGAAQQTLVDMGLPTESVALACALTYPLGVVGVILALALLRKFVVRPHELPSPDAEFKKNLFIAEFHITNPGVDGKSVEELASLSTTKFVISRIWRNGKVSIPTSHKIIKEGDNILVVTKPEDILLLAALFGEQVEKDWNKQGVDWNAIDSQLISRPIVVTRPEINGKKLSSLRLRNDYGINISRVYRSGVQLMPTPDLTLQIGDRITVVGEQVAVDNVESKLGNAVKVLDDPHLLPLFVGLLLGIIIGMIPIAIPGVSLPVKLGLAGGPIVVGILIGTFGAQLRIVTYTTMSANLMLRSLGLSIYLASLGLDSGAHFFETVMRPEGVLWLGAGLLVTVVPVVLMALLLLRVVKLDYGTTAGLLCGSMANPMALNYVNDTVEGDKPSVSYATVYPVCMFLRVIIAQLILMLLL